MDEMRRAVTLVKSRIRLLLASAAGLLVLALLLVTPVEALNLTITSLNGVTITQGNSEVSSIGV